MLFYSILKTLHFVGLISWMAGIFYLPRLLVYYREALDRDEPERTILARNLSDYAHRLYRIIMRPALFITFAAGFGMIFYQGWEWFALNIWLHFKLLLLVGMVGVHLYCKKILLQLDSFQTTWSSFQLRLFNELPTTLLLGIVLLAVTKGGANFWYILAAIFGFGGLLFVAVRWIKNKQKNKS
jgi:protoporphyrinogen IX oxidase